ncbi:hypothetical protein, partial [Soonwooa sp.]|uniref:hypothetical protein n=1 Tax=Soonwooa sp. TaxID=1938592 RepID=UPI002896FCC1
FTIQNEGIILSNVWGDLQTIIKNILNLLKFFWYRLLSNFAESPIEITGIVKTIKTKAPSFFRKEESK